MGAVLDNPATTGQLAHRILEQQRVIAEQHRALGELVERIRRGEEYFGVSWEDAHEAVRSGMIEDSYDVCVWLLDINIFTRLANGR